MYTVSFSLIGLIHFKTMPCNAYSLEIRITKGKNKQEEIANLFLFMPVLILCLHLKNAVPHFYHERMKITQLELILTHFL